MKLKYHFAVLCLATSLVSCASGGKTSIAVHDQKVFLVSDNRETAIDELARNDDFPFALLPTYSYAADSSKVAFIGHGEKSTEIFLFALGMKQPVQVDGEGIVDGRTSLVWSPDNRMLLFTRGERVWLYDAEADSAWKLSQPEEDWVEDYDPSFSEDGKRVYFFRGSRFEYVFSGDKYSSNLDGTGLKKENEEMPTYPPEDLRGDE
jgi:hypothetical protein